MEDSGAKGNVEPIMFYLDESNCLEMKQLLYRRDGGFLYIFHAYMAPDIHPTLSPAYFIVRYATSFCSSYILLCPLAAQP